MYRRILFAVDDDEALPAAIPVVAAYARQWGSEVHVLHVHRGDPGAGNGSSRRLVESVIERFQAEGVRADGEIQTARGDEVPAAIAKAVTGAGSDLVALGSHGRSHLAASLVGSVSSRVAADLEVPVLLLRASALHFARPRMVLVAVDGSQASDEALAEASELATAFGARVHVLHVRLVIAAQGVAIVEPEAEAEAVVDRALASLRAAGVDATGETVVDHGVAGAIVRAAEWCEADLVVLGSRRPSSVAGLWLGSTAHEVIRELRRPVMLARRVRSED